MSSVRLNEKQIRFVDEYLKDYNATQAYLRAGYEVADERIAGINANRLLRNARILEVLDQVQADLIDRLGISDDWLLKRFKLIYLESMETGDRTSALKALESLAKHVGLYGEDNRQKIGASGIDELRAKLLGRGIVTERVTPAIETSEAKEAVPAE